MAGGGRGEVLDRAGSLPSALYAAEHIGDNSTAALSSQPSRLDCPRRKSAPVPGSALVSTLFRCTPDPINSIGMPTGGKCPTAFRRILDCRRRYRSGPESSTRSKAAGTRTCVNVGSECHSPVSKEDQEPRRRMSAFRIIRAAPRRPRRGRSRQRPNREVSRPAVVPGPADRDCRSAGRSRSGALTRSAAAWTEYAAQANGAGLASRNGVPVSARSRSSFDGAQRSPYC